MTTRCPLCARHYSDRGLTCRKCWHRLPAELSSTLAAAARVRRTNNAPYLRALLNAGKWMDEREPVT